MPRSFPPAIVAMALMSTLPAGCGTIMNGATQTVSIRSVPEQANVTIYDTRNDKIVSTQKTPCLVTLKRGQGYFKRGEYKLVMEKEGYASSEVVLWGKPSGWYIGGNLLLGDLIGWLIVDPITGGMWCLSPEEVDVNLTTEGIVPAASGPGADVCVNLKTASLKRD